MLVGMKTGDKREGRRGDDGITRKLTGGMENGRLQIDSVCYKDLFLCR